MKFAQVNRDDIPIELLLEADPAKERITVYLSRSVCYGVFDNDLLVATCIVESKTNAIAEIHNVAVLPTEQRKGVGTKLLTFVLSELTQNGVRRVELGTGSFGYQLTYYQRLGFRVESVLKDYFVQNYAEPIYENGIQHYDMLWLYKKL